MSDTFINSLIQAPTESIMTPKMFQYRIFKKARRLQKSIVLPEVRFNTNQPIAALLSMEIYGCLNRRGTGSVERRVTQLARARHTTPCSSPAPSV